MKRSECLVRSLLPITKAEDRRGEVNAGRNQNTEEGISHGNRNWTFR